MKKVSALLTILLLLTSAGSADTAEQLIEKALAAQKAGQFMQAGQNLTQAAQLYLENEGEEAAAQLYQYAARAYFQGVSSRESELIEPGLKSYEKAGELYGALGRRKEFIETRTEHGLKLFGLLRWGQAEQRLAQAYREAQKPVQLDSQTRYVLTKSLAKTVEVSHRWPEALTLYQETIGLARETAPQEVPDLQVTLAAIYSLLERLELAEENYLQAAKAFREAGHLEEARDAEYRLGIMFDQRRLYEQALPVWNRLLEKYNSNPSEALQAQFRKAFALEGLGKYQSAYELLTECRERLPEPGRREQLDARRVKLLWLMNKDEEAEALLNSEAFSTDFTRGEAAREADKIALACDYYESYLSSVSGPERPRYLNRVAYRHLLWNEPLRARELLTEALELLGEDKGELWATVRSNLGESFLKTGQARVALGHFEQVLPWYEKHGDPEDVATLLNNSAACESQLGHFSQALSKLERAVEVGDRFQKPKPIQATVYNAIGYLNVRMGRYEDGLEYYKTALSLHRAQRNSLGERTVLFNRGAATVLAGREEEGLRTVEEALGMARAAGDIQLQATILGFQSGSFLDTESRRRALATADRLLPQLKNNKIKALVMIAKARLLLDTGKGSEAEELATKALELLPSDDRSEQGIAARALLFDSSLASRDLELAERLYEEILQDVQVRLFGLSTREARSLVQDHCDELPEFASQLVEAGRAERAFEVQEVYHSLGLAAMVRDVNLKSARVSPELNREKEILAALIAENASNSDPKTLSSLMTKYQTVLDKIERQHLASGALESINSVDVTEVQRELNENEALLQYIFAPSGAYLVLVTPNDVFAQSLGDRKQISELTERVLKNIRRVRSERRLEPLLDELSQLILGPVLEELSETERLVVVPHGPLYGFPFAVLPVGEEPTVDRFSLTVANSASSWVVSRKTGSQGEGALVAGLGESQGKGDRLQPLPGTEEEVAVVSKLLPAPEVYLGARLQSEDLERESGGKAHLHFATHGVVSEEEPLLSGLECHDRRLTAADIFGWKLDAGLAVLSACDSGSQVEGNRFLGLSSAFQYAGVPTLVVSLWPVSDEATGFWMEQFYKAVNEGSTPSEAARSAQIATREKWSHPYYWAPFTAWGDGLQ